jgi:deoxycytidine triphosphate deaminase
MAVLPEGIGTSGSFLVDRDLEKGLSQFFREGTFDPSAIRHASYQLRLGDVVKVSSGKPHSMESPHLDDFQQLRWQAEGAGEFIEVEPRRIALLYTKEYLTFPDNTVGFVISRGLLFSLGLTPENTYVDPGFQGNLYITIVNHSQDIVRLYKGMALVRLFVFRLADSVARSYVAGTDIGIEQQLKKTPVGTLWQPEELKTAEDCEIEDSIRKGCSIGDLIKHVVARQRRATAIHHYWLIALSLAFVIALLLPVLSPVFSRTPLLRQVPKEFFTLFAPLVLTPLVSGVGRRLQYAWHRVRG